MAWQVAGEVVGASRSGVPRRERRPGVEDEVAMVNRRQYRLPNTYMTPNRLQMGRSGKGVLHPEGDGRRVAVAPAVGDSPVGHFETVPFPFLSPSELFCCH